MFSEAKRTSNFGYLKNFIELASSQEITSKNWSFIRVRRLFQFLKLGLGSKLALWYFVEPPVKDQNRFFDFKNHQSRVSKYPVIYPPTLFRFQIVRTCQDCSKPFKAKSKQETHLYRNFWLWHIILMVMPTYLVWRWIIYKILNGIY